MDELLVALWPSTLTEVLTGLIPTHRESQCVTSCHRWIDTALSIIGSCFTISKINSNF